MRMLTPRELARAQGFPDWYVLERTADGAPITKTAQVRGIGNSGLARPSRRHWRRRTIRRSILFLNLICRCWRYAKTERKEIENDSTGMA